MGPYGSENFKTLLLLQIAAKRFQTCPEFSSQRSSQKYIGYFEILSFRFLMRFFFKFHDCSLWENEKPQLSEKRATDEQN